MIQNKIRHNLINLPEEERSKGEVDLNQGSFTYYCPITDTHTHMWNSVHKQDNNLSEHKSKALRHSLRNAAEVSTYLTDTV